jgi:membrane protein DedA with SNARE-associated domain
MVEHFDAWISAVGPAGYWVLGVAAMLEYLVPPFPGDSILLLGGVYAVRGDRPWLWVFIAVTLGSVLGAALNYAVGKWLSDRLDRHPERPVLFGKVSHARIVALEERMRRSGGALIAVNRFMPGIRALVFLAAGASRMPFKRVMMLGAISAMAWNALVLGVGFAVGGNAERLQALLGRYQTLSIVVIVLVVATLAVRAVLRARRAKNA